MTAADVKEALRRRHAHPDGSWVCVEEAFCGWQSMGGGIDLLAIGAWRTAKAPGLPRAGLRTVRRDPMEPEQVEDLRHPIVAYEVKVSRGDFRRELYGYVPGPTARRARPSPAWPHKAVGALQRAHYFLFATPAGLLRPEEVTRERPADGKGLWVPWPAGLVEVGEDGKCRVRLEAVPGQPRPWLVPEIAELLRHGIDPNRVRRVREENVQLRWQLEQAQRQLAGLYERVEELGG